LVFSFASLQNGGTVNANVPGGTLSVFPDSTNIGTFRADSGATLDLRGTTLTNFASSGPTAGTLTGGTHEVRNGTLSFSNGGFAGDIVTNASRILLDSTSGTPQFLDLNGSNAFRNFANNASGGAFTIQSGVNLTSALSNFTNDGSMTVGTEARLTWVA
jgi:hypothetical protein